MRTFVSSNEIAHLWAHQTQPSARCSASMSFDGPAFYSYGTVIGYIAESVQGERVFLLSAGQYSNTTSRHQGIVRAAIPSTVLQFVVPGVSHGRDSDLFHKPIRIMDAWTRQVGSILERANEAKHDAKKVRIMAEAAAVVAGMQRFAGVMGIKRPSFPIIPGDPAGLADALKREAARKTRIAAAVAKKAARAQADQLAKWMAGKGGGYFSALPVALRIVGDEVETTRGAVVPVAHARRALKLVDKVRTKGQEWHTNGHTCHVGHYQLDRIAPDGTVYAGCHVIPF